MGLTQSQRQEIDDLENLAAGQDFLDRLLQRLTAAARDPYTLEQLADGRARLAVMHAIVVRRRDALRQLARGTRQSSLGEKQGESDADRATPDAA